MTASPGSTNAVTMKLPIWAAFCLLLAALPAKSATQSFASNFDGAESPISEGGVWSNSGLDWTNVVKNNGIAFGTQSGTNGFDDSYAILSGFSPNQAAAGKIQVSPSIDGHCPHEVELLLRMNNSAHNATGYECNLAFDGSYADIVRWNGALGDFTILARGSFSGLKDGDTIQASIDGNVITVKINGTQVVQATDNAYTAGNPGVGFYRENCGTGADFGLTSYSVVGSDAPLDQTPPAAPTNLRVQ